MAERRKPLIKAKPAAGASCLENPAEMRTGPFTMVIFGGAGDLAGRKLLPALYDLHKDHVFSGAHSVVGVGFPDFDDQAYRKFATAAIRRADPGNFMRDDAAAFVKRLHFIPGSLDEEAIFAGLCDRLGELAPPGGIERSNLIYYLAVPPRLVPVIIKQLRKLSMCRALPKAKIIVEKPFGKDEASAEALNKLILEAFDEKQIFRIDHYLAKETVQNILFFRFGNSLFEPVWNTRYVDHVQITVAEDIGVEHRGPFYEDVGVIRDIVQNHLMQVLAMVAMEPPAGFDADLIRDEKIKVFHSIRRMDVHEVRNCSVVGQYGPGRIGGREVRGYRAEDRVSRTSETSTFFAGKFHVDNWRWAGVPFYLRTGKRLPRRTSQIYIEFKKLPLRLFGRTCERMEPNGLFLSIQPKEAISLSLTVKRPGIGSEPGPANMVFDYARSFRFREHPAYERVLFDCIRGDLTLFPRQDAVELTWAVLDPVIKYWEAHPPARLPNYAAGSWGPRAAAELMAKEGRAWRLWNE